MNPIDLSDLVPEFLSETREHLDALEKGLLTLESQPDAEKKAESVRVLFRSAHTIKGSARVMGFGAVQRVAHAMEDILGELREKTREADRPLIDRLLQAVDTLRRMIGRPADATEEEAETLAALRLPGAPAAPTALGEPSPAEPPPLLPPKPEKKSRKKAPAAPPPRAPAAPPAVPAPVPPPTAAAEMRSLTDETVRVAVSRLDELLRLTAELVSNVQRLSEVENRTITVISPVRHALQSHHDEASRALLPALDAWRASFLDGARLLPSVTERIEQEVMGLRLFPVSTVFGPLPRMVRDLAKAHGKEMELTISGETTELDRRILQGLSEPLLHVVRNAVDHGLEPPDVRLSSGKPATGRLAVTAYRRGGEVCIEIADDGRGMSPKELRDAGVRKRLLTPEEAAALDDTSALDLIFLPGFSTSTLITDTSGRGVGMDAVRSAIQKLGGSVETRTELGKGTAFTFVLPLTVTLARVLLLSVGDRTFALPTGSIERIVRASRDRVQAAGGREQLVLDGEPIPLHRLSRLLLGPDASADALGGPAILFRVAGQRAAFAATKLLDEREVVLKPLGEILAADMVSGATILADGEVALVLDPAALVRTARTGLRLAGRVVPVEGKRKRILVVDDSTTTRELERSILAASGYDVETAQDGDEGWTRLQAGGYDLLVTDVEMPGLTGFELTRKVRSDPRLGTLPVVIITTLDRDSERRQGLAAGAQAYLVKNAFDQTALLETIERLLP